MGTVLTAGVISGIAVNHMDNQAVANGFASLRGFMLFANLGGAGMYGIKSALYGAKVVELKEKSDNVVLRGVLKEVNDAKEAYEAKRTNAIMNALTFAVSLVPYLIVIPK